MHFIEKTAKFPHFVINMLFLFVRMKAQFDWKEASDQNQEL